MLRLSLILSSVITIISVILVDAGKKSKSSKGKTKTTTTLPRSESDDNIESEKSESASVSRDIFDDDVNESLPSDPNGNRITIDKNSIPKKCGYKDLAEYQVLDISAEYVSGLIQGIDLTNYKTAESARQQAHDCVKGEDNGEYEYLLVSAGIRSLYETEQQQSILKKADTDFLGQEDARGNIIQESRRNEKVEIHEYKIKLPSNTDISNQKLQDSFKEFNLSLDKLRLFGVCLPRMYVNPNFYWQSNPIVPPSGDEKCGIDTSIDIHKIKIKADFYVLKWLIMQRMVGKEMAGLKDLDRSLLNDKSQTSKSDSESSKKKSTWQTYILRISILRRSRSHIELDLIEATASQTRDRHRAFWTSGWIPKIESEHGLQDSDSESQSVSTSKLPLALEADTCVRELGRIEGLRRYGENIRYEEFEKEQELEQLEELDSTESGPSGTLSTSASDDSNNLLKYAYVSVLGSPDYFPGVVTLRESLRLVGSKYPFLIIVGQTAESVIPLLDDGKTMILTVREIESFLEPVDRMNLNQLRRRQRTIASSTPFTTFLLDKVVLFFLDIILSNPKMIRSLNDQAKQIVFSKPGGTRGTNLFQDYFKEQHVKVTEIDKENNYNNVYNPMQFRYTRNSRSMPLQQIDKFFYLDLDILVFRNLDWMLPRVPNFSTVPTTDWRRDVPPCRINAISAILVLPSDKRDGKLMRYAMLQEVNRTRSRVYSRYDMDLTNLGSIGGESEGSSSDNNNTAISISNTTQIPKSKSSLVLANLGTDQGIMNRLFSSCGRPYVAEKRLRLPSKLGYMSTNLLNQKDYENQLNIKNSKKIAVMNAENFPINQNVKTVQPWEDPGDPRTKESEDMELDAKKKRSKKKQRKYEKKVLMKQIRVPRSVQIDNRIIFDTNTSSGNATVQLSQSESSRVIPEKHRFHAACAAVQDIQFGIHEIWGNLVNNVNHKSQYQSHDKLQSTRLRAKEDFEQLSFDQCCYEYPSQFVVQRNQHVNDKLTASICTKFMNNNKKDWNNWNGKEISDSSSPVQIKWAGRMTRDGKSVAGARQKITRTVNDNNDDGDSDSNYQKEVLDSLDDDTESESDVKDPESQSDESSTTTNKPRTSTSDSQSDTNPDLNTLYLPGASLTLPRPPVPINERYPLDITNFNSTQLPNHLTSNAIAIHYMRKPWCLGGGEQGESQAQQSQKQSLSLKEAFFKQQSKIMGTDEQTQAFWAWYQVFYYSEWRRLEELERIMKNIMTYDESDSITYYDPNANTKKGKDSPNASETNSKGGTTSTAVTMLESSGSLQSLYDSVTRLRNDLMTQLDPENQELWGDHDLYDEQGAELISPIQKSQQNSESDNLESSDSENHDSITLPTDLLFGLQSCRFSSANPGQANRCDNLPYLYGFYMHFLRGQVQCYAND